MADELKIPFGKPARVGNYKVWRTKYTEKVKDEKSGKTGTFNIEQINVSDLTGTWQVKIPQTSMMFATISEGYNTTDDALKEQFLGMLFTNMRNVCLINSEALHDAFFFLQEMMTFPYLLLSETEMAQKMREGFNKLGGGNTEDFEKHISKMCEYRKRLYGLIETKKARFIEDYERQQEKKRKEMEDEMKNLSNDEKAEDAFHILAEEKEEGNG